MTDRVGLATVLAQVPGKWVAVDLDTNEPRVVADSPYELVAEIRRRGISNVAVVWAPAPDEPELVGLGQAVPPPFPWTYPYQEDGPRLGTVVLRPIVPIIAIGTETAPPALALVDSGCEHVLAAPWLAASAGVDPEDGHRSLELGIGGETLLVRFVDQTLRLLAPGGGPDDHVEWRTEVGFVSHWRPTWPMLAGQVAFLDRFTVTMSRLAQRLAVEDRSSFDQRFGVPPMS